MVRAGRRSWPQQGQASFVWNVLSALGQVDDGRRFHLLLPERADKRETVELGQHPVHHEDVVLSLAREGVAVQPVGCRIRGVPRLAKRLREILAGVAIVFDNEQAHGRVLNPGGGKV